MPSTSDVFPLFPIAYRRTSQYITRALAQVMRAIVIVIVMYMASNLRSHAMRIRTSWLKLSTSKTVLWFGGNLQTNQIAKHSDTKHSSCVPYHSTNYWCVCGHHRSLLGTGILRALFNSYGITFVKGPRPNMKTVFPRYGDLHVKDKTITKPSYL